jgi:hypothetical protein
MPRASSWEDEVMEINIDSCRFCDDSIIVSIKSMIESGMSLRKASKEIAKAANSKIGHELYSPNSIRQRYFYYTGTKDVVDNEPCSQQPEKIKENDNQTKSKGGRRRGAGRKPRPQSSKNHIVSKEFKSAFERFYNAISREKNSGWAETRREAVEDHVKEIINLINS